MNEHIVDERCLNNIVNFLIHEGYKPDAYYTNGQCAALIKEQGYDLSKGYDSERLLQYMRFLNIYAVDGRFPEEDYCDFMDKEYSEEYEDFNFRYRSDKPNIWLALQSIRLWSDPCEDEDIDLAHPWDKEGSKLCGAFRKMIDIINDCTVLHQHHLIQLALATGTSIHKEAVWRQPYTNK